MLFATAVFAPLLGSLVALLFGKQIGDRAAQAVTIICMVLAAICGTSAFVSLVYGGGAPGVVTLATWVSSGDFTVTWALRYDTLSAVMVAMITFIATLIHIYSVGYMGHEPHGSVWRFFSYLSLFTFAMLMLVTADNLLQLFFGWEGVGLASYLLIGYWYHKPSACAAAIKAFVVNRIGDLGFALGIALVFVVFGSISFDAIFAAVGQHQSDSYSVLGGTFRAYEVIGILLFIGAMGKSAQLGLHVWLPDAMEGPTPISALIHAATMVAAGVFLVARLQPLYAPYPLVQLVIAVIGTITLFLGASIALTQQDLKKGLAYSTVSQLGYMMLAMGCGAPVAGMFHLVTHAFFKAMLFLGSGSVIHAMEEVVGHEPVLAQDMRLMGGLRKYMPVTSITFLIGCVAISGIPPLAGFWSKDEILGQAFHTYPLLWAAGFLTAGMTAFYMFRLYFLTFEGSFRGNDKAKQTRLLTAAGKSASEGHDDGHDADHHNAHPHESGWQMAAPLVVLAVPSVLIGLLGTPWHSRFAGLLEPEEAAEMAAHFSWGEFLPLAGASVAMSVAGIGLAVLAYFLQRINLAQSVAGRFPKLNNFLANKWYLDAINDKLFVQGSRSLAKRVLDVDSKVVDGVVNLTGLLTLGSGEGLKYFETGRAQFYALIVFAGVIALVVLFGAFAS